MNKKLRGLMDAPKPKKPKRAPSKALGQAMSPKPKKKPY